jgi:hypothetical protein
LFARAPQGPLLVFRCPNADYKFARRAGVAVWSLAGVIDRASMGQGWRRSIRFARLEPNGRRLQPARSSPPSVAIAPARLRRHGRTRVRTRNAIKCRRDCGFGGCGRAYGPGRHYRRGRSRGRNLTNKALLAPPRSSPLAVAMRPRVAGICSQSGV